MGHTANRQLTFFLVVFVLFQAMQMSLAGSVSSSLSRDSLTASFLMCSGETIKVWDWEWNLFQMTFSRVGLV